MSGIAEIYNAELSPGKDDIAARFGGVVTLLGGYRLVDPDGDVGIEVLVGSDIDGRSVQIPLTYRGAEIDAEHTLTTMEHSVLGKRWVSNALGDPVAVAEFIRCILEGDNEAARSDGVPPVLSIRGSGSGNVEVGGVKLLEVTRQRAVGTVLIDGRRKSFQLRLPHLLRRMESTQTGHNTSRMNLIGWLPAMPEEQRVVGELNWLD